LKDIKGILDLDQHRLPRLVLLIASALVILTLSALVYAGAVFQKALNLGTANGVTGSGSTVSSEMGFPSATIAILVLQVFLISLSVFGFPPKLPKRLGKNPRVRGPLASTPGSKPGEKEEWEESTRKDESGKTSQDVVGDILESLRKKGAATDQ
jgi:hypothetical protein